MTPQAHHSRPQQRKTQCTSKSEQTVTVVYIPILSSMEASFQKTVVVWYQMLAYEKVCVYVGVFQVKSSL